MNRHRAVLWALVASLAFPALAEAEDGPEPAEPGDGRNLRHRLFGPVSDPKPPWAVEAPGAADARYGLGLDVFFEHQESLRFTFMEQTLRSRNLLTGAEQSSILRTEPGLLNRKFDLRLDLAGAGLQPAFAIPLPRTLGLYPTLVLQAAAADVSLDFRDLNRATDSSSLDGRGALFSTGLDLTRSLCRSCPWFAGASYRFQKLPDLNADRSPPFNPPGFEILEDEVLLSRDIHEASTRIGYGFSGNRAVSYLGASHRWTDVEIEDHLRYRDPSGAVETSLSSRTRLESEETLALAGVEARLGPRLFSRLETSVGEGDWGVLLRVAYLGPDRRLTEVPSEPGQEAKEKEQKEEHRAREIAGTIASQLAAVEAAFLAGWKNLEVVTGPDGQPAYLVRDVERLLATTEKELLAVLGRFSELEALGDWVSDEFRDVRVEFGLKSLGFFTAPADGPTRVALVAFSTEALTRLQAGERTINKSRADAGLEHTARSTVGKPTRAAQEGRLLFRFTFDTDLPPGTQLFIYPRYNRSSNHSVILPRRGEGIPIYLGSYSFEVQYEGVNRPYCHAGDAGRGGSIAPCPLNLLTNPCRVLWCDRQECTLRRCLP